MNTASPQKPGSNPTDHIATPAALAVVMLILTPFMWAGHSVVAKTIATDIPLFSFVSFRWLVATAVLLVFVWPSVWRQRWILAKHWKFVAVAGFVGPALFPCFLYAGLMTTTVTNTSIIQTSVPGLVPVFAWLLIRDRMTLSQFAGIVISSIGVLVIISRGDLGTIADVEFVPGDLFILGGFTIWSLYTVIIRMKPADLGTNAFLAASMFVGFLATSPLWIWEFSQGITIPITTETTWAFGYIIIFPTLLSYYFYNRVVETLGPNKAGLASHMVPPLGVMLGVIFLDETLALFHAVSFAIIIAGVVLVIRGGPASKSRAPS